MVKTSGQTFVQFLQPGGKEYVRSAFHLYTSLIKYITNVMMQMQANWPTMALAICYVYEFNPLYHVKLFK